MFYELCINIIFSCLNSHVNLWQHALARATDYWVITVLAALINQRSTRPNNKRLTFYRAGNSAQKQWVGLTDLTDRIYLRFVTAYVTWDQLITCDSVPGSVNSCSTRVGWFEIHLNRDVGSGVVAISMWWLWYAPVCKHIKPLTLCHP